jgi:pimeloyl-ACP methyl ester carboxylesterase
MADDPFRRQLLGIAGLVLGALVLGGCYVLQTAVVPIPVIAYSAEAEKARGLVVFLPGYGDGAERFEQQGLVSAVRSISPDFDMVAVNAHFGYYRDRSIVERLHQDVIAPRADSYEQIWLVGVSLGGAGAGSYVESYGDQIDRVILLAPFLGDEAVVEPVVQGGGLKTWKPSDPADIEDDVTRHFQAVWRWYKRILVDGQPGPDIMIGFGEQDRLAPANRLLAGELEPGNAVTIEGGHKWSVWQPVFDTLFATAVDQAGW